MSPEPSLLAIAVEASGVGTSVVVSGELDLGTVSRLREQLDALLHHGTGPVEVDLSGVSFCDSVALATLVQAHLQMKDANRALHVVEPSPPVARVLELAGLDLLVLAPTADH